MLSHRTGEVGMFRITDGAQKVTLLNHNDLTLPCVILAASSIVES